MAKKNQLLSVPLCKEDYGIISKLAEHLRMPMSVWARSRLVELAREEYGTVQAKITANSAGSAPQ